MVGAPSNSDFVITSGQGSSTIPGKVKGSSANILVVQVEFTPKGPIKNDDGTIAITSDASNPAKQNKTVKLKGKATQKKPTATSTATATATATATTRLRPRRRRPRRPRPRRRRPPRRH